MEQDGRDQRDDQEESDKPTYSHVVKAGSAPFTAGTESNAGLAPPSTPSNPTYHQQQQHYLTAPTSARLSRSASRSRPMPPFTPGFGSRQPSYTGGGGMKTSRSVSRVRRLDGVASERGDDEHSDDDVEYAYRKNVQRHAQTAHRPTFAKSITTAGPSRRDWERQNEDNDDDDGDEPLGQDDEIVVRDRGEDLIRKRMRERKKAKRLASASANAAAREARARDFAGPTATSASSPRDGQHDTSFQSYQPERTAGISTSLSSVPHTPAHHERQGSVGRGKSTSRPRGPTGVARTLPSTPGVARGPSGATPYEYFPSMAKGYTSARPMVNMVPREEDEGESNASEQVTTPTRLEPSAPNFSSSTSVEAVDWAYLDHSENARPPGQQQPQQLNASQYGSRNPSRAESIVSDVISDVVRGDRSSAIEGGNRRMSQDGEEDYDDDEGEDQDDGQVDDQDEQDEDDDDQDDEGVTMRDRQDVCRFERMPYSAELILFCVSGNQH